MEHRNHVSPHRKALTTGGCPAQGYPGHNTEDVLGYVDDGELRYPLRRRSCDLPPHKVRLDPRSRTSLAKHVATNSICLGSMVHLCAEGDSLSPYVGKDV